MPLTMGFYNRQDIPFYYALADAFTICDQHFCSSITPTVPNRAYFWCGTVREKQSLEYPACVRNEQIFQKDLKGWTTFPERLEDAGISWRFYQNELTVKTGLTKEEEAWLGNYGCNVLEYFAQYNVKFAKGHRDWLNKEAQRLTTQIETLKEQPVDAKSEDDAAHRAEQVYDLTVQLSRIEEERLKFTGENFDRLSARKKSARKSLLHQHRRSGLPETGGTEIQGRRQ